MTILTDAALEFAKEHVGKFYDSDFFPKPFEFDALWHQWDEVKKELMSKNIGKIPVTPPRVMAIAKPRGGFRVVHQLEPTEAIIYTALAGHIAPSIEGARMPAASKIACSYRFKIENGSFFSGGSGWPDFIGKAEELAGKYSNVLVTDISDFFNQIYLHRLNNAIESADPTQKSVGDDIETFLATLNSKSSQGIPVGPAASVVMSEAVLIDVDLFIQSMGVEHTRYVDDIRVFANSPSELLRALERLTLYLYEHHRLTISSEKTVLMQSAAFVEKYIHNAHTEEKFEILKSLEVFNPYTYEVDHVELSPEQQDAQLTDALKKILEHKTLDLSLARAVIRTARRTSVAALAEPILKNLVFFAPVINDVVLYLDEVMTPALAVTLRPLLEVVVQSDAVDSQITRFWMEWCVAQDADLMASAVIRKFVFDGPHIPNQALAAITTKNLAWVRDHKTKIYNMGGWSRRSVLHAARVLPSDERKHWLKLTMDSPAVLDRWVAKWVLDTAA